MMTNYVTTGIPARDQPKATIKREPPTETPKPSPKDDCESNPRLACAHIKFGNDEDKFLKDVSAMPLANGATSVKVGVIRYNMFFGDEWMIPFSLLSSNVAGTANQSKLNSLKLLDPDQGNINLKWTYAHQYSIGPFCKFEKVKGNCNVGLNGGFRYMGLEKSTGQQTTATQNSHGLYLEAATTLLFPIFNADPPGKDAGQLALRLGATRYRQSNADTVLFPEAHDANGNPMRANKSYNGIGVRAQLSITDRLALEANHYRAMGSNSFVPATTTLSVSYELDPPKK